MSFLKTILAHFHFNGQPIEMPLLSARIKDGIAFLRPKEQSDKVFAVRAEKIEIFLDNLGDDSVRILEKDEDEQEGSSGSSPPAEASPEPPSGKGKRRQRPAAAQDFDFLEEKSFSAKMYASERAEIINAYKAINAKRSDFLLACVRVASPKRVNAELKRIQKEHEAMQDSLENQAVQTVPIED